MGFFSKVFRRLKKLGKKVVSFARPVLGMIPGVGMISEGIFGAIDARKQKKLEKQARAEQIRQYKLQQQAQQRQAQLAAERNAAFRANAGSPARVAERGIFGRLGMSGSMPMLLMGGVILFLLVRLK